MNGAKQKILTAASDLFLEGGLPALSVRAIARRAGVSTIGIYSHFQGKQGVLDALYIEGFERVSAALEAAPDQKATRRAEPRRAVLHAVRRYLHAAQAYPAHHALIFGADSMDYEPSAAARRAGIDAFELLTDLAGLLLPPAAERAQKRQAALELWALTHGFVGLRRHAITRYLEVEDWEPVILTALERQIEALQAAGGAGASHERKTGSSGG